MIYTFGTYQLDTTNYELYDGDYLCKLDPRTFELLSYLVENRDHVVSREELLKVLWPGHIISEGYLHNCIKKARQAIRDNADQQLKIKNVYGRGYRFVAETQEHNAITPMLKESQPPDESMEPSTLSSLVASAPIPQNVFVGHYEFVSVLCGTLAHPDALISCLGFEPTLTLRHTFFSLVKAEAQRHEALFKFYGAGGFLIFFGLPVAHEDDVRRAVKAGLRIQEGLYESCDALDPQSPVDATIQMGLHSGLIEIPSKPDPFGFAKLIKSETTGLAIWLHYLAQGGELLTSKATIPYLQEMIEYVEYDTIPIPRQSQPILVYQICGLTSESTDISPT